MLISPKCLCFGTLQLIHHDLKANIFLLEAKLFFLDL